MKDPCDVCGRRERELKATLYAPPVAVEVELCAACAADGPPPSWFYVWHEPNEQETAA